jgi:pyruvate/2-oxoglutarate dehydrogenase complex dihydrolipoamide dehydrogenase (E3) component
LTTRAIIVATGARPTIPNYKGLDAIPFYTSDTIWSLTKQPKRLLILGAGPIACELAQAFNRLGSHVIILARGERVMTKEDEDVSYFVMSVLQREGVELKMQHRVDCFNVDEIGRFVVCETSHGKVEIRFDEILLALGRTANTGGFGLSELGIVLNESGTVATDEYLATNIPTILACGDVAGPYQFTHMAAHQAWYASVNALFGWIKKFKVDYSTVPWVTYVDPEVARVGLNECEASKQEIAFEVTRYNFEELDRAIVEHNAQGFIKVITPLGKDTILGVTIVGQSAGELLPEFVLAMKKGIGLSGILATIHAYPTMAEANKYVAGEWKRQHAPIKLIEFVGKCLAWRRG